MSGAPAVVVLVLLEWTSGLAAGAAWTQSWAVVKRGHFRIVAWTCIVLGALSVLAWSARTATGDPSHVGLATVFALAGSLVFVAAEYAASERVCVFAGALAAIAGGAALVLGAASVQEWSPVLATAEVLAGAGLLGAVTNGMLLGHWYLNQPGLQVWALARITVASLAATAASAVLAIAAAPRLIDASTSGAAFGLSAFSDSFALAFFLIGLTLVCFTAVVAWMARRCVKIRSIQSATGLYYVAILTAGVAEFLWRYLMANPK
jgi:hypothetical protein